MIESERAVVGKQFLAQFSNDTWEAQFTGTTEEAALWLCQSVREGNWQLGYEYMTFLYAANGEALVDSALELCVLDRVSLLLWDVRTCIDLEGSYPWRD